MLRTALGYVVVSCVLLASVGCSAPDDTGGGAGSEEVGSNERRDVEAGGTTDTRPAARDASTPADASNVASETRGGAETFGGNGGDADDPTDIDRSDVLRSDVEREDTERGDADPRNVDRSDADATSTSPWRRNRPYDVVSRDVSFQSENLQMKGTLDRPKGVLAPVPGVVVVHGSGPNSRTGRAAGQLGMRFFEPVEIHADIGEHLASRGYAVLRYDKRSCGSFNNCAQNGYPVPDRETTPRQFVEDAVAALDRLADASGVDVDELYVIGHSQGGKLAPLVVSKRSSAVRGAVLLAATPASPLETLQYQYDKSLELLQKSGLSKKKAERRLSNLKKGIENLKKLEAGNFSGDRILDVATEFWRESLKIGDEFPGIFKQASQPMLSLSGSYDYNIPPQFARQWTPLFNKGSARLSHRLVVQNCITHAMNCITEPDPQKIQRSDVGTEVAPKVLSRLVQYLDRVHRSLPVSSP